MLYCISWRKHLMMPKTHTKQPTSSCIMLDMAMKKRVDGWWAVKMESRMSLKSPRYWTWCTRKIWISGMKSPQNHAIAVKLVTKQRNGWKKTKTITISNIWWWLEVLMNRLEEFGVLTDDSRQKLSFQKKTAGLRKKMQGKHKWSTKVNSV